MPTTIGTVNSPRPGWSPPNGGCNDECMRQALSCAIGVHPNEIRFINPGRGTSGRDFWAHYRAEARRHGWELADMWIHDKDERRRWADRAPTGLWIAVVRAPARQSGMHAIVMDRTWVHRDSNPHHPRTRAPVAVHAIVRLTKIGRGRPLTAAGDPRIPPSELRRASARRLRALERAHAAAWPAPDSAAELDRVHAELTRRGLEPWEVPA